MRKLCIQALAARDESRRDGTRAGGWEVRAGVEEEVKVEEERDRGRGGMEKQDAALEVDGVSCYVLLSTLGRSPTPTTSLSLSLSLPVFPPERSRPKATAKRI